jgi:cytochrome c oxidase subunit II
MAFAIALILLVVGTIAFHVASPWWFTPIASNWGQMDDTVNLTFWVTGAVFVAVNLFMAYCVVRYRHRKGREMRAEYEPENKKLEWWLTILTSVGVAAMLAPGLLVWAKFVTVPDDAAEVEAVGQQWTWSYRLPGADGVLGSTDPSLVGVTNPFGLDPADDKGRDDVLVANPELHLPLNQPVKVLLRSKDVLHNFTVAEFRVKMDLVPGMVTYMWLTPTRTGAFDVLCEELCGVGHFAMRGRVVVDEPADYRAWLAQQPTYAQLLARPAPDATAGQATFATCIACHGANGEGNETLNAPKLAGQHGWYLAQQLRNFKHSIRGGAPGETIAAQMVPFASMLDDTAIENVVAHIATLPDDPPRPTLSGDASRGQGLYVTCANCHGAQAQGVWSTRAPRLANQSDWYLARQMKNFRMGVRGRHPQDFYGAQMAALGRVIDDDRESADLVAYIGTLPGVTERVASAPDAPVAPAHEEH